MTLDAQLLRELAEKTAARTPTVNGIVVGPDSPLLSTPTPARRAGRAARLSRRKREHEIQVALFANVNNEDELRRRPALAFAFAVPNGGDRRPGVAAKLKAEGVKPGILDVWLPVPRGGYVGLVIEIKDPSGTLSPEQAHWLAGLEREGWKTVIHTTATGAFAEMTRYVDQPRTTTLR